MLIAMATAAGFAGAGLFLFGTWAGRRFSGQTHKSLEIRAPRPRGSTLPEPELTAEELSAAVANLRRAHGPDPADIRVFILTPSQVRALAHEGPSSAMPPGGSP